MLTIEEVKRAIPPQIKMNIEQEFVDKLNDMSDDPDLCQHLRDNFISFTSVLKEGTFKIDDYKNAVIFVSYLKMGNNHKESYMKTFPERYNRLIAEGKSNKEISSYVSMYRNNRLVCLILEQSMIAVHVYYQDYVHKALNVLATEMITSPSSKVRVEAADKLLNHIKKPETKQIELDIGIKDNSGLNELKDGLAKLAKIQQEHILNGRSTKDVIQNSVLIDVTPIKKEEDE